MLAVGTVGQPSAWVVPSIWGLPSRARPLPATRLTVLADRYEPLAPNTVTDALTAVRLDDAFVPVTTLPSGPVAAVRFPPKVAPVDRRRAGVGVVAVQAVLPACE